MFLTTLYFDPLKNQSVIKIDFSRIKNSSFSILIDEFVVSCDKSGRFIIDKINYSVTYTNHPKISKSVLFGLIYVNVSMKILSALAKFKIEKFKLSELDLNKE